MMGLRAGVCLLLHLVDNEWDEKNCIVVPIGKQPQTKYTQIT